MPFVETPFTVTRVDPVRWRTALPLIYRGRTQTFVVPAGYVTDFASVPWFVQWFIPRTGVWTLAAVLHDWLITDGIRDGIISSRNTDGVFRRVLREQRTGFVRRWLMWAGVRAAAPFSKHRRPSEVWRDLPLLVPIVLPVLALAVFVIAAFVVGAYVLLRWML